MKRDIVLYSTGEVLATIGNTVEDLINCLVVLFETTGVCYTLVAMNADGTIQVDNVKDIAYELEMSGY